MSVVCSRPKWEYRPFQNKAFATIVERICCARMVYVERDCKYLRAVPEPTPNEEHIRGMGFGERRGE